MVEDHVLPKLLPSRGDICNYRRTGMSDFLERICKFLFYFLSRRPGRLCFWEEWQISGIARGHGFLEAQGLVTSCSVVLLSIPWEREFSLPARVAPG